MAVYGEDLGGGRTAVYFSTKSGIVRAVEEADGSVSKEGQVAALENAADTLETSVKQDPDHKNVTHVRPGDDDAARKARTLANQIRNTL